MSGGWSSVRPNAYRDLQPLFIGFVGEFGDSYDSPLGVSAHTSAYLTPDQASAYSFDNAGLVSSGGTYYSSAIVVSGSKGSTTLTPAFNTSQFAAIVADAGMDSANSCTLWAGVLRHIDGTWGVYSVTAVGAGSITVKPALRESVASSPLGNFFEEFFSQHLSRLGSRALADHVFGYSPRYARRQSPIYRFDETATSQSGDAYPWVGIGGHSIGADSFGSTVSNIGNPTTYGSAYIARSRKMMWTALAATSGHGVAKTIAVSNKAGWLELFVGIGGGTNPCQVNVYADYGLGSQFLLAGYHAVYGLDCIRVPFRAGLTNVGVEVLRHPSSSGTTNAAISGLAVYEDKPADPAIFVPGTKGVWLGDSWGTRYNCEIVRRLNERLRPIGAGIQNLAVPSTTTADGITRFNAYLNTYRPDFAVIEFFVNDSNGVGGITENQWIANLKTLVGLCKAAGAKPIVLMPLPCANRNQVVSMCDWARDLDASISTQTGWYT